MKFKKAFETAKHKGGLDVKIILLEKNKRYLNALSRFGEVIPVSLEDILYREEEDFQKIFTEALFSSEAPSRVKGVFVRDGKESIMVYEEDGIIKGLIVRIPFIPLFQRMVILYLIEKSREKN